MMLSRSNGF